MKINTIIIRKNILNNSQVANSKPLSFKQIKDDFEDPPMKKQDSKSPNSALKWVGGVATALLGGLLWFKFRSKSPSNPVTRGVTQGLEDTTKELRANVTEELVEYGQKAKQWLINALTKNSLDTKIAKKIKPEDFEKLLLDRPLFHTNLTKILEDTGVDKTKLSKVASEIVNEHCSVQIMTILADYQAHKILPNGTLFHSFNEGRNLEIADVLAEKLKAVGAKIIKVEGKFNSPDEVIAQVARIYEEAEITAQKTGKPVVIFLDKLESVALNLREQKNQAAYIDAVNQLKLLAEGSSKKGVHWLFTTSKANEIEPAILRRGRIDQIIPVGEFD